MDLARIAELLRAFVEPSDGAPARSLRVPHPSAFSALGWEAATTGRDACQSEGTSVPGEVIPLTPTQLQNISTYIDLLLRWNSRINLTAIRNPEEIVTRHFGESFFAARHLFPSPNPCHPEGAALATEDLIDFGSGAGFPGIPIKIWAPELRVTLIESNQKKATFLREVARTITLTNVDVFSARAQDFPGQAAIVTLRAVERFGTALVMAARLVAPGGQLALLIGQSQFDQARQLLPSFEWRDAIPVPKSASRLLLTGCKAENSNNPREPT